MKIWVDADACPNPVKKILFKAAERVQCQLTLVANHAMAVPASGYIHLRIVPAGFDVADNYLIEQLETGDLLVTQDIPLAAQAVEKQAVVLSPRGQVYSKENIRQRLQTRNIMETLRNAGQLENATGPAAFSATDQRNFANALDRYLRQADSA